MSLPEPFYEKDGITIFCADCREILPLLPKVDLVLTDPPYGIGWKRGVNASRLSVAHAGIVGDHDTASRDEALQLTKAVPAIVFGSLFAPHPARTKHVGVYEKPEDAGVVGSTIGLRRDVELIFFVGEWPLAPARRGSVFRSCVRGNRGIEGTGDHPHVKPVDVVRALASLHPGTILDPFMGSGTTLVAAKQLGRQAIGIEIEERYCEIAVQRLAQGVLDFAGETR